MNVDISDNVGRVLKYLGIPVFFAMLVFLGGFEGLPVELMVMVGLILLGSESTLVPYDIGKEVKDEAHTYEHEVISFIARRSGSNNHRRSIRYYSKTSLYFVKFLEKIIMLIWISPIIPIVLMVYKSINS